MSCIIKNCITKERKEKKKIIITGSTVITFLKQLAQNLLNYDNLSPVSKKLKLQRPLQLPAFNKRNIKS
jgi:UDP-N-acetylglucosamine 2-epimerase